MKTLENLKLSLQDQRFPEDSVKSPFTVTDFILAELTLLLFSMENGRDAKDACFNLRKFELFGTLPPGEIMRRYYLARIKLKACSGQQKWNKMIENYMSSDYDRYRLFEMTPETIVLKKSVRLIQAKGRFLLPVKQKMPAARTEPVRIRKKKILGFKMLTTGIIEPNRPAIYSDYLSRLSPREQKSVRFADNPDRKYDYETTEISDNGEISITVHTVDGETAAPVLPRTDSPKGRRDPIRITLQNIREAAVKITEENPHNSEDYSYFIDVINDIELKKVADGNVSINDELTIDELVNIVGMVSSGKTTLMKIISYILVKRGLKVFCIMTDVTEVIQSYLFFENIGIQASPYVSRLNRGSYIRLFHTSGEAGLPRTVGRYLQTKCSLDGKSIDSSSESIDKIPRVGREPCARLTSHNAKKKSRSFVCPRYNICPTTQMEREVYTSNIVLTTAQALLTSKIGTDRQLLLSYILENADVVIFDECDSAQKTLDKALVPTSGFNEFIRQSRDFYSSIKFTNEIVDIDYKNYVSIFDKTTDYGKYIMEMIRQLYSHIEKQKNRKSTWNYVFKRVFYSMTLIHKLQSEFEKRFDGDELTASMKLIDALDSIVKGRSEDLFKQLIINLLRESYASPEFDLDIRNWLEGFDCSLTFEEETVIKIILAVISFDRKMRELCDVYELISPEDKRRIRLFDFLQMRFNDQQLYLPDALNGNIFGMRYEKKRNLEDLILYRQYAFGRAAMTLLPYLRIDEAGNPAGPHALLLSGTSYAPGSLESHVQVPVSYILGVQNKEKLDFLRRTRFTELFTSIRVSGQPSEELRLAGLRNLSENQIFLNAVRNELDRSGRLLLIVNSYEQCGVVTDVLNWKLRNNAKVCRLIRPGEKRSSGGIFRNDIRDFSQLDADILIAPAKAIDRGYNIVDETGHAVFTSLFLMVRPMPVPNRLEDRTGKLNGLVEQEMRNSPFTRVTDRAVRVIKCGWKYWYQLEHNSMIGSLGRLPLKYQIDVTASLFTLINQLYGRLARITDPERDEAHIYFCDAAFRSPTDAEGNKTGYDFLDSMYCWMKVLMNDYDQSDPEAAAMAKLMDCSEYAEVSEALYAPVYQAFKAGIFPGKEINYDYEPIC